MRRIAIAVFSVGICFGVANAFELDSMVSGDIIKAASKISIETPVPQRIEPTDLEAKKAEKKLKKDLAALGISARVSLYHNETFPPSPELVVEFSSGSDLEKAKDLFSNSTGHYCYMGVFVSLRVTKPALGF
jgi:hypothetical protein